MNKRYTIEVREKLGDGTQRKIATIRRVIWAEQIGNFNPLFCRFHGNRTLIHSDAGDLSDPFRREESYAQTFHIFNT